MHKQIASALDRAARAHDESRALIEQCHTTCTALRATIDAVHRRRDARDADGR